MQRVLQLRLNLKMLLKIYKQSLNNLFRLYKQTLSPIFVILFGHGCRFTPTCSEYMDEAVAKYGIKGFFMGIKRVIRCNPFVKPGYDPVV